METAEPVSDAAAPDLALLADRLHSVAIRLLRAVREEDTRMGLSGPRASALSVLVFRGPQTLGELARAEQVRPPTMTRLVQALEAEGLVVRKPDARDGRRVLVRATAAGRRLLEAARVRRVAVLAARLETVPLETRADLARAVEALEAAFRRPAG